MEERYTVIVGRPQRFISQFDSATYIAFVTAIGPVDAAEKATKEAWRSSPNEVRGKLLEWKGLVVIPGWQQILHQY